MYGIEYCNFSTYSTSILRLNRTVRELKMNTIFKTENRHFLLKLKLINVTHNNVFLFQIYSYLNLINTFINFVKKNAI